MTELRVHNFSVSLDGFGAGPVQSTDDPLGRGGEQLHEWIFADDMPEVDRRFRDGGTEGIGATIMGRSMFGPVRGPWESAPEWRGWWGEDPPFHTPTYVLTHRPRPQLEMQGGTTFRFLDASPAEALAVAQDAAGDLDVRLGGGASSIRSFVAAGLVDHLHLVVVPIVLGRGTRIWDGLDGLESTFDIESVSSPSGVVHLTLTRRSST
jgi:dihydrofolate reductase